MNIPITRAKKVPAAETWRQMRAAYRPWLPAILGVGALSFVSALLEATGLALLVLLAKLATESRATYLVDLKWLQPAFEIRATTMMAVGVVVVVGRLGVETWASWTSARISADYTVKTRNRILGLFIDAAWAKKGDVRAADLQNMLTFYVDMSAIVLTNFALALTALANAGVLVASAFVLNPLYAGAICLVALVMSFALRPLTTWVRRLAQADMALNVSYARQVNEVVQLSREIEVFDVGVPIKRNIGTLAEQTRQRSFSSLFANRLLTPIYQAAIMLLVFGALGAVVASGLPRIEMLGITVLLLVRVASYTQNLQTVYQHIATRVIYLDALATTADQHLAAALPAREAKAPAVVSFGANAVAFSYKKDFPVLRDLTFEVKKGEMIGVVGPSGAGKSTLIKLLLGLYGPEHGAILVNGESLAHFDPRSWYRRVAYVPQEAVLASDTVRANIRFFRDGVSDADIEEAARLACLDDVIAALPKGYDTDLGIAGGELSGGQRQRIAIARALAGKPDVLILDEPTSALDPISEQAIRQTLGRLQGRLTTFIIAHRMSLVAGCDRLMVFEQGKMVAFDSPSRLATSSGYYQRALALARAEAELSAQIEVSAPGTAAPAAS